LVDRIGLNRPIHIPSVTTPGSVETENPINQHYITRISLHSPENRDSHLGILKEKKTHYEQPIYDKN